MRDAEGGHLILHPQRFLRVLGPEANELFACSDLLIELRAPCFAVLQRALVVEDGQSAALEVARELLGPWSVLARVRDEDFVGHHALRLGTATGQAFPFRRLGWRRLSTLCRYASISRAILRWPD